MSNKFQEVDWLIVDSMQALNDAREFGVPETVPVFSTAPAVIKNGQEYVSPLDGHIRSEDMVGVSRAALALARDLYHSIVISEWPEAALSAARVPIRCQALFYRAASLPDQVLESKGVVVETVTGRPEQDEWLTSPLPRLLGEIDGNSVVHVRTKCLPADFDVAPPVASFWTRLRYSSATAIAYRLMSKLSSAAPFLFPRGEFLVLRETELLKEAGIRLLTKGYALRFIPAVAPHADPSAKPAMGAILRLAKPLFERHIGSLLPASVASTMENIFIEQLRDSIERFYGLLASWRETLPRLSRAGRCKAILSNALSTPSTEALFVASREYNFPLIMFQHGSAPELCRYVASLDPISESSSSDAVVVYSNESAKVQEGSAFKAGPAFVAGMPKDYYRRIASGRFRNGSPPIWYVGTSIYLGSRSLLNVAIPDHRRCETEVHLIDEVLGQLPHRVLFKPYPARRYIDQDPFEVHAASFENIEVYKERMDLRYLGQHAKVIVTGRAGGTTAWCLMPGTPVVFIDYPDQAPLRSNIRSGFEEALFVFDAGEDGWEGRLRDFLSQPIEEIEAAWKRKAAARRDFIEEHLDASLGRGGGSMAARHVLEIIRDYPNLKEATK